MSNTSSLSHSILLLSDADLFKSKGVAHTLQHANTPQRSLSRASNILNESPVPPSGRESTLSSRLPSSLYQPPTSSTSAIIPVSTPTIENPITNLQEYCKRHMMPVDIKAEMCQSTTQTTNQRQL